MKNLKNTLKRLRKRFIVSGLLVAMTMLTGCLNLNPSSHHAYAKPDQTNYLYLKKGTTIAVSDPRYEKLYEYSLSSNQYWISPSMLEEKDQIILSLLEKVNAGAATDYLDKINDE